MTPIKSISGIIGIGPDVDEKSTVASIVNWRLVINEKKEEIMEIQSGYTKQGTGRNVGLFLS